MKTLMIIGAAEEHILGIQKAHEMGLRVFVTDGNPGSIGFRHAEDCAVASTYDAEATLQAAREYQARGHHIDGVWTLACDVPYTVAFVAEHLGLPSIGVAAALNVSDKAQMKRVLKAAGMPVPTHKQVMGSGELRHISSQMNFPVVVKPTDNRGARGVRLVREMGELSAALLDARANSLHGGVMVEKYLPGPQLSVEGVMLEGQAYIPAVFDRNYEYLDTYYPYIIENGGEMPSRYTQQYREEIVSVMGRAGRALGIENGPIKGDLVIHEGQIKVIEIAGRLSGGFFATVATPASCGVDLLKVGIQLALGEKVLPCALWHEREGAAAIRFMFPPQGQVKKIVGWDRAYRDEWCCYGKLFSKVGDTIQPYTDHTRRAGVVVAGGENREDAVRNAERLVEMVKWEVEGC